MNTQLNAPTNEISEQLLNGWRKNNFDYQINNYVVSDNPKPVTYVWQEDGIYSVRETALARFILKETSSNTLFRGLSKSLKEGCTLKIPKKIPIKMFDDMLEFFRYFYNNVMRTEIYVRIYYSPSKDDFYFKVPKQYVSQTAANWGIKYGNDPDAGIPEEDILVLQGHSHHNMTGSFSSIDDRDHQTLQSFHLVIGNIFQRNPSWELRFAVLNSKVNIGLEELFEDVKGTSLALEQFGNFKDLVRPVEELKEPLTIPSFIPSFVQQIYDKKDKKKKRHGRKSDDINIQAARLSMPDATYFGDLDNMYNNFDMPVIRGYVDDESTIF